MLTVLARHFPEGHFQREDSGGRVAPEGRGSLQRVHHARGFLQQPAAVHKLWDVVGG